MTLAPLSNKKLVRDLVTEIAPPAERFAVQRPCCEWRTKKMTVRTQARRLRRHAQLDEGAEVGRRDCARSTPRSIGTSSSAPSRAMAQGPGTGPALLFNNIKDYNKNDHAAAAQVFAGGLGSYRRVAMMLGLPPDTHPRELVKIGRTILEGRDPAAHRQGRPVQGEHPHRQGHRPLRIPGAALEPGRRRPLHPHLRRRASPRTRPPA